MNITLPQIPMMPCLPLPPPRFTQCGICGDDLGFEGRDADELCDGCWWGMRLDPDGWKAELEKRGIKVERTGGCLRAGSSILCMNSYSREK